MANIFTKGSVEVSALASAPAVDGSPIRPRANIAAARTEIERLQSEISRYRSQIEFNRQRAEEITELIVRSKREIAAAEAKREQQQAHMKEVGTLVEQTAQLLQTKQAELAQLNELMSRIRADRAGGDSELQALRVALAKMTPITSWARLCRLRNSSL